MTDETAATNPMTHRGLFDGYELVCALVDDDHDKVPDILQRAIAGGHLPLVATEAASIATALVKLAADTPDERRTFLRSVFDSQLDTINERNRDG